MPIESPALTERELRGFFDETIDHERRRLADRLEAASARLTNLVQHGIIHQPNGQAEWSAHEVLTHIVALSKFYGVVTYQVGSGKLSELDMLGALQNRDPASEQLSALSPDELLALVQSDHQRTIAYLRSADASAMQRQAALFEGLSATALWIAQFPLCAHLEIHLDQLERTLRR